MGQFGVLEGLVAAGADLSTPRRLAHFVYVTTRRQATGAAATLRGEGWTVTTWPPSPGASEWTVVAEVRDVVVDADILSAHSARLNDLAASYNGRYDGCEATV